MLQLYTLRLKDELVAQQSGSFSRFLIIYFPTFLSITFHFVDGISELKLSVYTKTSVVLTRKKILLRF